MPERRVPYLNLTGPSPLVGVRLNESEPEIWCKLEFLNPSGSIKDRIATYILQKGLRCGEITAGGTVVEASSGSTSIAMALACAQLGLRFVALMPEGVSSERVLMIRGYGGAVDLTPASEGIRGAIARAQAMADAGEAFWPRQFSNPDNAETHRRWTAHEVVAQIPGGQVDAVVAGVGTGGTLVGLYQGCCDHGCHVLPVAARPIEVAGGALGEAECCSFSSRVPGVVDGLNELYRPDELKGLIEIDVTGEEAIEATRALIHRGYPVGPSSGLNYAAAAKLAAQRPDLETIVTVFCDRMERYFSTELFAPWR